MKKFQTVFLCFFILYWATGFYIDIKFNPHSGYWLAFQLGLLVMGLGYIFIKIRHKENSKWTVFFVAVFWTLFVGYFGYQDIVKYKNNACLDKFGLEFNKSRQSRGIPVIPANWHEDYRFTHSIDWEGKGHIIGHHRKSIMVDSACAINSERDDYNLRSAKAVSRSVSIITIYAKGKGRDTISFAYEVGDSTRTITRRQADSIFAAEKIKKDY